MAIQIGAKLDSGFDDPIGMLKDCHRRIESFLGIFCVVVDRAQGRRLTEEEQSRGSSRAAILSDRWATPHGGRGRIAFSKATQICRRVLRGA